MWSEGGGGGVVTVARMCCTGVQLTLVECYVTLRTLWAPSFPNAPIFYLMCSVYAS